MTERWLEIGANLTGEPRTGWYKCGIIAERADQVKVRMDWNPQVEHWVHPGQLKTTVELFVMGINAEEQYRRILRVDSLTQV